MSEHYLGQAERGSRQDYLSHVGAFTIFGSGIASEDTLQTQQKDVAVSLTE